MSRYRSTWAKFIFSLFVLLALYISVLISVRNDTTIFIALLTLAWHGLANIYCAWISSYRFMNPNAKYIGIKNKFIRKIFVRSISIDGVALASERDERTNIIGLVLNIINTLLFVLFELLLFMPKISCDPYIFTLAVGARPRNYSHLKFELHSLNEIIPAEGSRAFFLVMSLVFLVFVVLFERQLKEHRQRIERNTAKTPRQKPFKKIEWYSPLYTALVDISARQNNKKHKFWYEKEQLKEIEDMVSAASENAELKTEEMSGKLVSFTVFDTLNNHVMFTGFFIK